MGPQSLVFIHSDWDLEGGPFSAFSTKIPFGSWHPRWDPDMGADVSTGNTQSIGCHGWALSRSF